MREGVEEEEEEKEKDDRKRERERRRGRGGSHIAGGPETINAQQERARGRNRSRKRKRVRDESDQESDGTDDEAGETAESSVPRREGVDAGADGTEGERAGSAGGGTERNASASAGASGGGGGDDERREEEEEGKREEEIDGKGGAKGTVVMGATPSAAAAAAAAMTSPALGVATLRMQQRQQQHGGRGRITPTLAPAGHPHPAPETVDGMRQELVARAKRIRELEAERAIDVRCVAHLSARVAELAARVEATEASLRRCTCADRATSPEATASPPAIASRASGATAAAAARGGSGGDGRIPFGRAIRCSPFDLELARGKPLRVRVVEGSRPPSSSSSLSQQHHHQHQHQPADGHAPVWSQRETVRQLRWDRDRRCVVDDEDRPWGCYSQAQPTSGGGDPCPMYSETGGKDGGARYLRVLGVERLE
jgi:hypothetical protein